ncbi:MAG: stage II sporulation protein M [Candidatus Diapherotrites archaeon]
MVLEAIFGGKQVIKKPYLMLFFGLIVSMCSNLIIYPFFKGENAGLLAIAFITIASMPLIHNVLLREEKAEARVPVLCEKFFERNVELIAVYSYMTMGVIAGYAILYLVLPESDYALACNTKSCVYLPSKGYVFGEQQKALDYVANVAAKTGKAVDAEEANFGEFFYWFSLIFENNFGVLVVALIMSFVFGAGAIFLISWNASVVGTWIGQTIMANNHFRFLGLIPHGIPEFMGYFLGAIGGALVSVAVTRKKVFTKEIERITIDSFIIIAAAVISLLVGAAIEAGFKVGYDLFAFSLSLIYLIVLGFIVIRM